jgi:FkbM family methyltransferase
MKLYSFLNKLIPAPIKNKIKRALIKLLEKHEDSSLLGEYANVAYSQEGEDRILYSLFSLLNKKNGFYVDVGAHHPHRFSNTHLCYLQGWRGINIDANVEAIALFRETRPKDINVSIGVGEKAEKLTFYIFNEPALNTFDAKVAQNVVNNTPYKIIGERIVEVMPLSQLLDIYLPKGQGIDFLSVDVEGKDFDVLKSNDWSKYIPLCVLVEIHSGFARKEGFSFDEVLNSEITQYLQSKGYSVFAKTLNTIFFIFKKHSLETDLKVFIYDLPTGYLSKPEELSLPSETFYAIADFFKNSMATSDPTEADFFFVPLNLIQSQFKNEDPKKITGDLKYLSGKKDHIIVATGDFSQRSKKNHFGRAYEKTYDWLENFILLALESTNDLIPNQDIGIIPFNTLVDNPYFNTNNRIYLYSYLGSIKHELLPENHVRTQLSYLENKPDVLINTELDGPTKKKLENNYGYAVKDDFELLARNSTFTLAPAGYGKWTYRFFHAIQWGSIPVLFSDDYIKPFSNSIPYDSFSITLPEKNILNVDKILRTISSREIEQYQENLKANQSKFTRYAFFEMLVRELASLRQ